MSYILYGDQGSGSAVVECVLAEVGAACEVREIDLGAHAQRGDDYAAINPQRKVPTLITPEGTTLTESSAIVVTLAERHPDAGLFPAPGSEPRAQALRWMLFVATELYSIVEINDYPERFAPPDAAPAVREAVRDHWRARWQIVDRAVAGPWLLGDTFCAADIYIAVVSRWAQQVEWRPANIPRVEAIAAGVARRPALEAIWRRHFRTFG